MAELQSYIVRDSINFSAFAETNCLYRLRKIAYNDYLNVTDEQNNEKELNLEDWC